MRQNTKKNAKENRWAQSRHWLWQPAMTREGNPWIPISHVSHLQGTHMIRYFQKYVFSRLDFWCLICDSLVSKETGGGYYEKLGSIFFPLFRCSVPMMHQLPKGFMRIRESSAGQTPWVCEVQFKSWNTGWAGPKRLHWAGFTTLVNVGLTSSEFRQGFPRWKQPYNVIPPFPLNLEVCMLRCSTLHFLVLQLVLEAD